MSPSTLPTSRGTSTALNPEQLETLRKMLEQQRAFRLEQLAQLRRPAANGPLSSADPEILRSLVAGARAALQDVQAALRRMDAGTYGQCVSCAEPVGIARLEILPQTARCLACERSARAHSWPGAAGR
jgi:DnaK suppressor protein